MPISGWAPTFIPAERAAERRCARHQRVGRRDRRLCGIENRACSDGDLSLHSNLNENNQKLVVQVGGQGHPRDGMHPHGQVIAAVLKLLDPVKTVAAWPMATTAASNCERVACRAKASGPITGQPKNRQEDIKAGATVVEKSNTPKPHHRR